MPVADQETQNQLPAAMTAANPTGSVYDLLRTKSVDYGKKAFESANALPAPSEQKTVSLPLLKESTQTGYKVVSKKIVSSPVVCCTVGPFLLEKNTAYDFIMMANAAAKDGITLQIRSGFRTMDEQTRLYNERKNPAVAKEKGVAAFPGTSNHQSGIAIDIDVKLTKQEYLAGRRSAEFLWLAGDGKKPGYASEFGFDHKEGHAVGEPWHWTHLPTTIVGTTAYQSATGFAVLTADTAVNAAAGNQSGTLLLASREGHDDTTALARNLTLPLMSRQTAFTERAIFSAYQSNYVSSRVGQLEAAKLTLDVEPKAFPEESITSLVYNFTTGLWGDKKAV